MITIKEGDCLELMKELDDESIDLVITDPPYKIVQGGCSSKEATINPMGGMMGKYSSDNIDLVKKGKIFVHNDIEFKEWLPHIYRVLKEESHCYIMINGRNLNKLQYQCEKVGFMYQNLLVWDKGNATPNRWYMQKCEFILMLRKGKAKNINNLGTTTLISTPNIKRGTKTHPTEKPRELMKILIENSSLEGETILDPFVGVGNIALECRELNRNFIGYELDENYFNIAKERLDWEDDL